MPLCFPCSACGKGLKTNAALAGAKVKCPHCGQIMLAPQPETSVPPLWKMLLPPFLLAMILWATFVLKLRNLDHTGLTRWDEVFHAVVAQNVMKHPLEPTLVDAPYLPYDYKKWGENHVWLHKPILPFWQIAISFMVLGVNAFALRLPAAILSTGAAWLTYLIGKELLDRRAALFAATLQAANPFLMKLIHGYQFADAIDIALLFWVEVGIYFLIRALRTGAWRDVLAAGVAQGLAYLSKSYLAAIIFGIALTAWLLPLCRLTKRDECRIGPARLLGLLAATLLTVSPWLAYCLTNYPEEFAHEHAEVWRHLYSKVEIWAAPWDRLVFDYLIAIYGVFYTPILVATIVLIVPAVVQRHTGLWLLYAWGLGVILPHLFAVTKTPSATVIGMPAFLLLLGHLVAQASRGERWPLAALTGVLAMSVLVPAVIKDAGVGYPSVRAFGAIMRQSLWVLHHVAGALAFVAVVAIASWVTYLGEFARIRGAAPGRNPNPDEFGYSSRFWSLGRVLHVTTFTLCLGVLGWLAFQTVRAAWRVTSTDLNDPACVEVGRFARVHLPENAVLFCEERKDYEHLTTMFYADRTCYALGWNPNEKAHQVLQAGGIPYVVSRRALSLPPVYVSPARGPTVYLWRPQ